MAPSAEVNSAAPRRRSVWSISSLDNDEKNAYAPRHQDRKLSSTPARAQRDKQFLNGKGRTYGTRFCIGFLLVATGVGLGVGISTMKSKQQSASSFPNVWNPARGTRFQVEILHPFNTTTPNTEVYDIDLYYNTPITIGNLHSSNAKVICYLSAGTYEEYRPDQMLFLPSEYGHELERYTGRRWVDTRSWNIRNIMKARLDLAVAKGCDGIDPDNTDGYEHDTGFPLTKDTALDYVRFLATEAHARNLSIGLRNSPGLVNDTVDIMQWQMNENCELFESCAAYRPYLDANKPVFHIVYPAAEVGRAMKVRYCNTADTQGFSTILKNVMLDSWLDAC
jgi:hypothetical protein